MFNKKDENELDSTGKKLESKGGIHDILGSKKSVLNSSSQHLFDLLKSRYQNNVNTMSETIQQLRAQDERKKKSKKKIVELDVK
jgi:hypothetical protein